MDLKITGFRGDSELIAGDIALLSEREIAAGQRDDVEEFRSENTVLGTPFRTTFRTAGEFALKKLNLSDLTADLIESDHIGSITGDVSIRSHVTPGWKPSSSGGLASPASAPAPNLRAGVGRGAH